MVFSVENMAPARPRPEVLDEVHDELPGRRSHKVPKRFCSSKRATLRIDLGGVVPAGRAGELRNRDDAMMGREMRRIGLGIKAGDLRVERIEGYGNSERCPGFANWLTVQSQQSVDPKYSSPRFTASADKCVIEGLLDTIPDSPEIDSGEVCATPDSKSSKSKNYVNPSLNLANCNLSSCCCVLLARKLRFSDHIESLDISANSIADQGASALSAVLLANKTLTSLDAGSNGISHNGVQCIAAALRTNTTLEFLELSFNGFGNAGAVCIADLLLYNSTIRHLGLGFNGILEPGACALSQTLTSMSRLRTLELSYNLIGDGGTKALAKALKVCTSLETLGLVSNGITDEGAFAIAEALEENKNLEMLGMSSNCVGDAGATKLAQALYKNDKLRALYLEDNEVGAEGVRQLSAVRTETCSMNALAEEIQEAFMMGLQSRLGSQSIVYQLDPYLCREILQMSHDRHPRVILCSPRPMSPPQSLPHV